MILITSFYKNAHLVDQYCTSLISCKEELKKFQVKIVFYNDSPDDFLLQGALSKAVNQLTDFNIELKTNIRNLGFIQSVNQGLRMAVIAKKDALVVNSDALLFPGTISEMVRISKTDPLIGFVSPRSNNASICTFPANLNHSKLNPNTAFSQFQLACKLLPEISYTPTVAGFCLLIKSAILCEFGLFDEAYGMGYNEENDLIMRANQYGYRAVIANYAYAWHEGSSSFNILSGPSPTKRDYENAKLLHKRYPEYLEWTDLYRRSPEYRCEFLVSALVSDKDKKIKIGFDLSSFGNDFNGTREAGKRLVMAAATVWPENVRIVVFISRAAWFFYELDRCPRLEWGDIHEPHTMAAIIRFGQPFHSYELRRLLNRAPVIGIFMLDTISADCGYLRVQFPEELWRFTLEFSDIIFTNSKFTADQIQSRYTIGSHTQITPVPHSLTPEDYLLEDSRILNAHSIPKVTGDLLIVGNAFTHKSVMPTANLLASEFPILQIGCIGLAENTHPNVTAWPSGQLSESQMDALYSSHKAIIFPTHYEGFGLPLMHSLARGRPIFIRKLPVFEEIISKLKFDSSNVIWFETSLDLIEAIRNHDFRWNGDSLIGESNGWERSAKTVYHAVTSAIEYVHLTSVANRLRWFDLAFPHHGISPFMPPRIQQALEVMSESFEKIMGPFLRNPKVRKHLIPWWDRYRLKRRLKT